ncbi:MAG: HindIII family type II restriction endonuclease [Solirubrobacterales bacterium]
MRSRDWTELVGRVAVKAIKIFTRARVCLCDGEALKKPAGVFDDGQTSRELHVPFGMRLAEPLQAEGCPPDAANNDHVPDSAANLDQSQHKDLLAVIAACSESEPSFESKAARVDGFVRALSRAQLGRLLGESGFIPEEYAHDSSDEKLYAKAMDSLVAAALRAVGYSAEATRERSDAADVLATRTGYGVVLDAKAFRLSRTALNPKDYKITALSGWRGDHRYAALVGPLAGFPDRTSRLFEEAADSNVTLLTFSHLQFMLAGTEVVDVGLEQVWNIGATLLSELRS